MTSDMVAMRTKRSRTDRSEEEKSVMVMKRQGRTDRSVEEEVAARHGRTRMIDTTRKWQNCDKIRWSYLCQWYKHFS